jgi:hypothetical protein
MRNPFRGRRRLVILLALAAGLAVGAFAAVNYGVPYWRHWQIQRDITVFKANPTQANAAPLILALYRYYGPGMEVRGPTEGQDFRDLIETLLDLKVEVKPSYEPNTPIVISLASGNDINLKAELPEPGPGKYEPAVAKVLFQDCGTELHVLGITPMNEEINSESVWIESNLATKLRTDGTLGMLNIEGSPLVPRPQALVISKPGIYFGRLYFSYRAEPYSDIETTRDVSLGKKSMCLWREILFKLGLIESIESSSLSVSDVTFKVGVSFEIRVGKSD